MKAFMDSDGALDLCDGKSCTVSKSEECESLLRVPCRVIQKCSDVINVVTPESKISNCITKSYGKYVKGTGALLATQKFHLLAQVERLQELCCSHSRFHTTRENGISDFQPGMIVASFLFEVIYLTASSSLA